MLKALANVPDSARFGPVADYKKIDLYRLLYPEVFKVESAIDVTALRNLIRKAWRAWPDSRRAQWYLFQLRLLHDKICRVRAITETAELSALLEREVRNARHFHAVLEEAQRVLKKKPTSARAILAGEVTLKQWREVEHSEPPELTEFDLAIVHLQDNLHRTRYCQREGCSHPYFFRGEKEKRYCSPKCAADAKRKHDAQWARDSRKAKTFNR